MRKLPKQGFYVFKDEQGKVDCSNPMNLNILYCSGTAAGNFYWNPEFHRPSWNKLQWTCLPSVKEIEADYEYHETNPIQVEIPEK